jgi:HEAT repeat protein/beta-lactamase regulating signal transducer with metallopeptidase domain
MRAELTLLAGSWLLTYLVHSTLLLGGIWLVTRWTRTGPALRDSLWKIGMVGSLLTSSLQVGLGLEPLGGVLTLRNPVTAGPEVSATPAPDSVWAGQLLQTPVPSHREVRSPAALTPTNVSALDASAPGVRAPTLEPVTAPTQPGATRAERYLPSLVWLWAAVAASLVLLYLVRRARAMRDIGPRVPVENDSLASMLQSLRTSGGVRRPIRLTCASGLGSPVALGSSEIVLPEAALIELDAEQQRSMLAHELAHLARRDPAWLALACMIERVFFLQPLNRVARAGMQESAELLCDDWAVHRTGSGFSLATCLVKVAEWVDTTPRPVPLAGMAEQRSQLVTRIHRLIEGRTMPTAPRTLWLAAGAVMLLGITAVAAPGVTPLRPDSNPDLASAEQPNTGDAPALEAMAADTDTVVTPAEGRSGSWSRMTASLRAMERRLERRQAAQANVDMARPTAELAARAELMAARAPRAMGWSGPSPRPFPVVAPRAMAIAAGVGGAWSTGRQRDTTSIAVPALIAALKDADVEVRRAAAHSLSNLDDPRAVPGLIEALKDTDAEVRAAAAQGLGSLEDKRAVPGLVALLKDGNKEVRRSALSALHSMPADVPDDVILSSISDSDPEVREAAIGLALSRLQDREDEAPADPRYVAAFTRLLGDASADTRQQAIEALGASQLKEAPAGLLAASKDKNADVRQAVANTLGSIGDARAVPTLKDLLADANSDVREAAVSALGEIRDRSALEALVGALKSSDPAVRRAAAETLGQRGD